MEQPFHQPRAFQHVAHEGEHRDGRQHRVHHGAEGLVGHQVEDAIAEAEVAEGHAEEEQREGNREAGQDDDEQQRQQHQAEEFVTHGAARPGWRCVTSAHSGAAC